MSSINDTRIDTDEINPFKISKDDLNVAGLREKERQRRVQAREQSRKLKIWEKGRGNVAESGRGLNIKKLIAEGEENCNLNPKESKANRVLDKLSRVATGDRVEGKEMITDFIAKKREMFLLQMSIDIKKEEIRKLEERARLKEDAFNRSEQMLEEDAIRFDAFLKENDKKAQDAIRQFEKETKKKMEKIQEIKRLNQQIQIVQANIGKHTEALEECLKYKEFLDQLTPPEWFEKQKNIKRERQVARRKRRIEKRVEEWKKEQKRKLDELEAKLEADRPKTGGRNRRNKREKELAEATVAQVKTASPPDFEDEPLTSSDEETPMYFECPQQLLEIFSALEEENLFLIQNTQETEQALEEVKQKFQDAKSKMEEKTASLDQNVNDLRRNIESESAKTALLKQRAGLTSGELQKRDETWLITLGEKVKEVYQECGFGDVGSSPTTLFMLSDIEARMEELLARIEGIPEDYIKKAEKEKGKKRRELKRLQQLAAQQKTQEERNRKALERSMQPPKKRTSRQVMFRSQPIREKVREEKKEITQEELDEIRHLT